LCLHRSSSGVDLPMKVSDMFGVGVPVLALGYAALTERLHQGVNGEIFEDADSLGRLLIDLWSPGDAASSRRRVLRDRSIESGHDRWMDGWTREAAPTLI
jgi:beta-1,4-mannosyltransferase